jgi:protein-S-isoprenylcysteine O-methyltransferase Ste14
MMSPESKMRRLIPPILFLMCLALMALLRWLRPITTLFPMPWAMLGIVPVFVGLLSGILGAYQFRKAKTVIRPFREASTLVTAGVFRYSRNPMYLGIVLVLIGTWILFGALSPVLGIVIFMVTADRWYIRVEEEMLRQKFGADFDAYRSKVRRWI